MERPKGRAPLGALGGASVAVLLALLAAPASWTLGTGQGGQPGADITGRVESPNGLEAGVWVIAETTDLPTRFMKSVVTDEQGRFLIPDLPRAGYDVWVRGYGLVDSDPVNASPGQDLTLTAPLAATPQEAAQIYPANYWYSLLRPPPSTEFPGTGRDGNGISERLRVQAQWLDNMKEGCAACHQVGNRITRTLRNPERFDSSVAAWDHRVRMGPNGAGMSRRMRQFGRRRGLQMFADWTDRIAAGAVPPAPPRPAGVERNVVVTLWEWGTDITFIHDEAATDKRTPTINADGPVYGLSYSNDFLTVVDPKTHTATLVKVPVRDEHPPANPASTQRPSDLFGADPLWHNPANPHTPMLDEKGRVWITTMIRGRDNPAWCRDGSDHPSARYFPVERSLRQVAYYDPTTQQFTLIDTCFGTHHLQFAEDEDDTLWFNDLGPDNVIGWLNTKVFDETGDERAAQGWCPTVLDTNGDGKVTKPWTEPGEPLDPTRDTRLAENSYGIVPNPVDGSIWVTSTRGFPGKILRLDPGPNPPQTCVAEAYEVPSVLDPNVDPSGTGFRPRGIDVDRNGLIWTALSGSSHLASFDRSKCDVLSGPTATGRHCVEGWTLYPTPEIAMQGAATPTKADFHYYNWVDQFNTLGLGENIPIATGSNSDSLLALIPETGEWVILRVPYPQGFHTRGMDGRIDDPDAGWKGRGVWATYAAAATWHIEGGKGVKPGLLRFQVRPHPLAN